MAGLGKAIRSVFMGAVDRAQLTSNSPVAVAVSGGCDSMALLWMAKQAFPNVVGLTVDHRLRRESADEAARTAELAKALGVQHQTLGLEWEGSVKHQAAAREKRYSALLEYCKSSGLSTLMTAHHLDDQMETIVYRLSMGSGIDGLAGMQEISYRVAYPGIRLVRPLLGCRKEQLIAVCKEAGLEWVEDPTNEHVHYTRNYIRNMLKSDPVLYEGLHNMSTTLSAATKSLYQRVDEVIRLLPVIDTEYGFVTLQKAPLLQLPPPILRRVLTILIQYVSADFTSVPYKALNKLILNLPHLHTTTIRLCYVFPVDKDTIGICAAPKAGVRVPIKVGEHLHWIGKWELKLSAKFGTVPSEEQYYIRPVVFTDQRLLRSKKYNRRGRKPMLPPFRSRFSFPVLTTESGAIVSIPHFDYADWRFPVQLSVLYKPLVSLDFLINMRY